jgi:hypothetical protein
MPCAGAVSLLEFPLPRQTRPVALAVSFFSRREDFSCCGQCLCVLRGQKSPNTEVTETLRVLRVKS